MKKTYFLLLMAAIFCCSATLVSCETTSEDDKKFSDRNLSEGVETIGEGVFRGCAKLPSITLPSTLKSIGRDAFNGCRQITSLDIPANVESIGDGAFGNWENLKDITCRATTPPTMQNNYYHQPGFDWWHFENATLRVPSGSVNAYKAAEGWKEFQKIAAL